MIQQKKREKFTDHDGGVHFSKFQKIKKLYIYIKVKLVRPKGEGGGQIDPPL